MISLQPGGTAEIQLRAHAKINVGLRIGERRPDGYHEIWSILQEIDLSDEIILRESPDLSFSLKGEVEGLPADEENLCLGAARLLRRETGGRRGAHIELVKRIPVGAGLGGGSSDAAAVLQGLCRLWNLSLKPGALLLLAAELGSDVPFFILGGCCLARGRGEILQKIARVLEDPMILIVPAIRISTAWAYKNIENYPLTKMRKNINFKDLKKADFARIFHNAFEPLIFSHFPALRVMKQRLLQSGAYYASLSGSGSSLYGAFHSDERARLAWEEIQVEGHKYLLNTG